MKTNNDAFAVAGGVLIAAGVGGPLGGALLGAGVDVITQSWHGQC
ncbi:hypothetical protein FB466_1805 [Klugiella xanthotipulae]|uniref:Uncharacterized protein n=1 Tax=Klugiella xanthotipulae TaxID=244735 RepID=A0A543HZ02_9MICO|nr:hypothetical protein FB466_1805 [Klugiella xanthotipulae]